MFIDVLIGEIEVFDHKEISGWGVLRREDGSERSAVLNLYADGVLIFRFDSYHLREDVYNLGNARILHSGFKLHHSFRPGTKIELRSWETGILFGGKSRFIPSKELMKIGLVAPARNEARFIIEWLAYHRICGIQSFYIGDNGGNDGTSELLKKLDAASIIKRFDFVEKTYFQIDFYDTVIFEHAISEECNIIATIDCDEFIVATAKTSVQSIVTELFSDHNVSALGLNWANYGSSNLVEHDDNKLVMEQYIYRDNQHGRLNKHAKPMFRPDRYRGFSRNVHGVDIDYGVYISSSGKEILWDNSLYVKGITENADWSNLRLNHYSTKSKNEFVTRKYNGRAADDPRSEAHRQRGDFFTIHDTNEIYDPMPPDLVDKTKKEIKNIISIVKKLR